MAVLAIIRLDGEPDSLLGMYDEHEKGTRDLPTTGLISHAVARTGDGLIMVDLWESDVLLGAYMRQPQFESELQRVGMPEPRVELHEVDRRR